MPKPAGRPAKVDRPTSLKTSIPTSLRARVELMLYSDLEECVPHGAWQRYICGLIEADLKLREQQQTSARSLLEGAK